MPLLIDFLCIKATALGDEAIQTLAIAENGFDSSTEALEPIPEHEKLWDLTKSHTLNTVKQECFGTTTQIAQSYFAAHMLSVNLGAPGGQGPVSTEVVGDVTTTFTLPYLNRTTAKGATIYGNTYIDLLEASDIPFRVIRNL